MADQDSGPRTTPSASDSLALRPPRAPFQPGPAAALLDGLISAMSRLGADAEADYERLLADARKRAPDLIVAIARRDRECAVLDYSTRWGLIFLASELKHPAALPYLRELALTPLPAETSRNPHSFSAVGEETILRTTAIEGIGHLAAAGRKDALDVLLSVLGIPSLSLRRAAVQAILLSPTGRRLRSRLVDSLPRDQRFLLELERPHVRDIPQIRSPEKHLSSAARASAKDSSPHLPGDTKEGPPLRRGGRPLRKG